MLLLNLNEDKSNAHMCTGAEENEVAVRIDNVGRGIERERERERKQSLGDRTFFVNICYTQFSFVYLTQTHTYTYTYTDSYETQMT